MGWIIIRGLFFLAHKETIGGIKKDFRQKFLLSYIMNSIFETELVF